MSVRQSASLVAGVCTLCVAASTSVSPVLADAATAPGPQERPFELTAASDVLVDGVNVAALPLQNFVTALNALAGAAGGGNGIGGGAATSLQALPNLLYSQLVAGTLTQASATAAINAALATEQTALDNLAATPGKLIAYDVATLSALFGGQSAPLQTAKINSTGPELTSGPTVVDLVNVASLPLQNSITALNAVAGAAGGGDGTGSSDSAKVSFQALPNTLYSQVVAGTLTEASATKAINAAVATERTALTNLAATPGRIIATDVAAIQKLTGGFGAGALSANKVAPTTSGRHAAKTDGDNPVSSAVKAIKDASKGSYVGKHRADGAGENTSTEGGTKGQ